MQVVAAPRELGDVRTRTRIDVSAGNRRRLAYGGLAMRTRRFGEAVIAHATTNFLLALIVLIFGQWQLW